jgi:hypothetical protein
MRTLFGQCGGIGLLYKNQPDQVICVGTRVDEQASPMYFGGECSQTRVIRVLNSDHRAKIDCLKQSQ